ncbi:MAG: hypothetical protein JW797_11445 [Bradymonadales bacterium]|nr:hypothetical protein [Bradymonadales bacterium]
MAHQIMGRHVSRFWWLSSICLIGGMLAMAPLAQAQEDQTGEVATVEIRFWAFSRNPQFFAYQTTNHLGEQMLCVGQADEAEPVFARAATEETSVRDILISQELRDMYGWAADGVVGTTSPSGAFELVATPAGANMAISVRRSGRSVPIGTIPLISDGMSLAEPSIKEIRWSPDDTVVVVILHQVLRGEWPMEVDVAQGFLVPAAPAPPAPAPAAE